MSVGRLLELSGTSSKSASSAEKMTTTCSENGEFEIFNMNKLFSIVSPLTLHLAPRSLYRTPAMNLCASLGIFMHQGCGIAEVTKSLYILLKKN